MLGVENTARSPYRNQEYCMNCVSSVFLTFNRVTASQTFSWIAGFSTMRFLRIFSTSLLVSPHLLITYPSAPPKFSLIILKVASILAALALSLARKVYARSGRLLLGRNEVLRSFRVAFQSRIMRKMFKNSLFPFGCQALLSKTVLMGDNLIIHSAKRQD